MVRKCLLSLVLVLTALLFVTSVLVSWRAIRDGARGFYGTLLVLEMGLLEGEEVEVVGFAPLGDPIEIRLPDYRLSLRRTEAARVAVSRLP